MDGPVALKPFFTISEVALESKASFNKGANVFLVTSSG